MKVYQRTDIHHPPQPEKYKRHLYISWHFIHAYNQDVTTRITPEMAKATQFVQLRFSHYETTGLQTLLLSKCCVHKKLLVLIFL